MLFFYNCKPDIFFTAILAQNPLILDQFTADPTASVFDGRIYVYPSHDIPCQELKKTPAGIHNLVICLQEADSIDVDRIRFE